MPKRKDALIIAAVLAVAVVLLFVSRLMPKTTLEEKTADITMAPDAVEYLDVTAAPTAEPTLEPTEVPTAEPTEVPTAEPTEAPTAEPTEAPTAEPTAAPTAAPTAEPTEVPTAEPTEVPTAEPTAESTEKPVPAAMGPMPAPQTAEVKGHVVITLGNRQYGDPIPMDREKIITVRQEDGKINKVYITPDTVTMHSSSCENQDCVGQGEITLENYETRILSTYIICLPNNVTVEMVPAV